MARGGCQGLAAVSFGATRVAPEKRLHRPPVAATYSGGLGEDMATMSYAEQLKRPEWQKKRLQLLESAGWECSNCGDGKTTLHVHHRQYFKGRMAWEYDNDELAVLCEPCHSAEHIDIDGLKQILARVSPQEAFALLSGFHKPSDWIDRGVIESGRQTDAMAFAAGFVAYIVHGLEIDDMRKVGEFAASLHGPDSECRLWFTHSRGNTFGEESE